MLAQAWWRVSSNEIQNSWLPSLVVKHSRVYCNQTMMKRAMNQYWIQKSALNQRQAPLLYSLSEDDQAAIQFVNQLKSQFSKEEFERVLHILQTLADDKSKIDLHKSFKH
jgi:hypothetical protein